MAVVARVQFLFITVMCLFGAMLVGACIGCTMDEREKRKALHKLLQPECGFHLGPEGEWLWHAVQEPLKDELGRPEGTAVRLAAVFGMPFARLRAVLPEELFPGTRADALGRRSGLSVEGMRRTKAAHDEAMGRLRAGIIKSVWPFGRAIPTRIPNTAVHAEEEDAALQKLERGGHDHLPDAPDSTTDEEDDAPRRPADAADVVGTALALSFIECCSLLTPVEMAERRIAAQLALEHVSTGLHWRFNKLREFFTVMLVRVLCHNLS